MKPIKITKQDQFGYDRTLPKGGKSTITDTYTGEQKVR